MRRLVLSDAIASFEKSGCELEDVIVDLVKPFGKTGIDLNGYSVPVINSKGETKEITAVRYNDDHMEGKTPSKWIKLSLFNDLQDWSADVNCLGVFLMCQDIFED